MVEKTKAEVFAAMQDLGFLRFETANQNIKSIAKR